MPYKIYTYTDPYRIAETDYWDEIKGYPHLCAARTLVNGLISVMRKDIESLMCPIDDIVNKKIFSDWTSNIGLRIRQYSILSDLYRYWKNERGLNDNYYRAISHNKDLMLDSLRLFIELDINPDILIADQLNVEHKMFVFMLKRFRKNKLFALPPMPTKNELKTIFNKQAEDEKKEKEKLRKDDSNNELLKKDIELIDKMISRTKTWDGEHVVIHGIHQFTPLQLKFIRHLDELGVEVIFLFNYLPEFKEIYSSWSYIYQQFDVPIYHDQKVKSYIPIGQFQKIGNAIAGNIGLLCEESIPRTDKRIQENYKLYKNEAVQEFDNVSEFAGYISDRFMKAESIIYDNDPTYETTIQKRPGTAAVLSRMDEIVYTANKDVDDLLQVYHPEYARNRHFLAYPIGQFFTAIYALWNIEKKEIDIDYTLLRECFNSGIITKYNSERLLKTLMNLQPLFINLSDFTEFKKHFANYAKCYKQVEIQQEFLRPFQKLNIYNGCKVTKDELSDLYNAVTEINVIAEGLFSDIEADEHFEFKKHFKRLEDFMKEKRTSLANEEEKELITNLLTKLDLIQMTSSEAEGTFEDLRSGLYYFLKQKEEPLSDWFVKNFEQIDGDILNSKSQNTYGRKKIYHFACVSDKDMNKTIDELLPWPLSEMFIEKAYNPKDLQFQVYYASLAERSNFLRYALFYGLYFNQCETKLSFVKHYGDDATDYYEMLRVIGLSKTNVFNDLDVDEYGISIEGKYRAKKETLKYDRIQMAAMFLCPFKFLLDYVLNEAPVFSGTFLIQKYFENVLIENTWRTISTLKITQNQAEANLTTYVSQEVTKLREFFVFLRETDILDLQRRVENYIKAKVFKKDNENKGVRQLDAFHMEMRKAFGDAWYGESLQDTPEHHMYSAFEQLTSVEDDKKVYSTHKVPPNEDKQLIESTLDYINNSDGNCERVGSWCTFCPNKNICLEPYVQAKE